MSNMSSYCPDCKTPLMPRETKCVCGWTETHKAERGMKCLCGRLAAIYYRGWVCFDCHHHKIKGTDKENWRDKMISEKITELGLEQCGKEPDWSVKKRAIKRLTEMGGIGEILAKRFAANRKP